MKLTKTICTTSVSAVALAIGCCAFGTSALAQSDEVETVVVTATGTNISGIAPVGTEAVTLDRESILNSGQLNLTEVVRQLPQVTNLGIYREGSTQGGYNATQANAVNLRGLGIGGTLTLVDGHRVPSTGTVTTLTDANQLPIAMIARIEMIVDGNSAIYGSDAIGGVVNFVTRKDFEGVEVNGRFTYVDGYNEYGASITAGQMWNRLGGGFGAGNVIVSYDYTWRDKLWASSRERLSQDLTQFGGIDYRIQSSVGALNGGVGPQNGSFATPGVPGNVIVPGPGGTYTYYGLPMGNGTGLTFANLSTTPNLVDSSDYATYMGSMVRHQVDILFNQELNSWVTFSFEGLYTRRHTRSEQFQSNGPDVCVPTTSPYYIAGIPGTAGQMCATGPSLTDTMVPGITMQYNFQKAVGSWGTDNPDENYALISGLKAKLPGDWTADLTYTLGVDHTCGICRLDNNSSFGAFQHQVILGNINPFSSEPLTAAQRASFVGSVVQYTHNVLDDVVFKADGPLFDLPGGTVKAAFGFEYTYTSYGLFSAGNISPGEEGDYPTPSVDNEFITSNTTKSSRSVAAAFAEVFVPIIGEANALPLVKELNFDGAVRFDHYSDFGDTINPKLGLTWKVFDDLSTRASWGTSFRAPTLTDGDPYVGSFKALFQFPNSTTQVACAIPIFPGFCLSNAVLLFGAQPGLKPEKSINWSLGFDYKPHWLDGLELSTTYYNIHYTDRLQGPPIGEFLTSDANFALYSKYAKAINNPPGCVNGNPSTYDPALIPYINAVGLYTLYRPVAGHECSVQAVLDGRMTNVGTTNQEGLDINTGYHFDTPVGLFDLRAMVTIVLNENAQYVAGAPVVSRLNTLGYPVAWRGRGGVTWMDGPWVANLFMNYVGSYKNTTPLNTTVSTHVSDWITFDAGVTYTFDSSLWKNLEDTRLSLNAQNLFDRSPPLVLTNGYSSFDPEKANIFGRILTVQFTKNF
jgi:iron complex outermembrane recepter protein